VPQPIPLRDLKLYWDWLQHWTWPQHWNWHNILHAFKPSLDWLGPLFGGVAVGLRKWEQRLREGLAANWPSTDATVLSASVQASHGYWVTIEYRYFARDEYRYGKSLRHFRRKNAAEEFAAAVRKLQAPVHFCADDPNISVLIERELRLAGQMAGLLDLR